MVVRSRQVPESEVMRALVSSALISGIDPSLPKLADALRINIGTKTDAVCCGRDGGFM
jgi:hypothetical protein